MNKPKILFIASVLEHIRLFHLPYLKWFQENGYETHIATKEAKALPNVDKAWKIDLERNPFKANNIKAYRQLKKIIDNENFVLINCHTPMASVITRLAARDARKRGTKLIYTAHGFHFYKGAPAKNWILFYPIEKYLTQYTDAIITINTEDYNRIKKDGAKKCKYFLVNGVGVNKTHFYPISVEDKKHLREKLGFPTNKILFVYAGRLAKDKNHSFIINSVKNHKNLFDDACILFAGSGELEHELKTMVASYNLNDTIKFIGYRTDIDKVYQASDYGISSSIREGLGLNLIEEMFCGVPAIAAKQRGHNEIIDNRINGFLFTINSEKEFIDIIKHIKSSEFNYKLMSENALQKAEKFELSNSLKAITAIYKQFL